MPSSSLASASSVTGGKQDGWNASLGVRVAPFLGFVADFSGHHGYETISIQCGHPEPVFIPCDPYNGPITLYTFLFGPRVSVTKGRFTPFAHALIGLATLKGNPLEVSPYKPFGAVPSQTSSSFADAFGGGMDIRLVRRIQLRLQADALHTWINTTPSGSDLFFTPIPPLSRICLRLSTGFVLDF